MLFSQQELQALLGLLNRTPMSPAELLWAQGLFQRLVQFCQPPKPEEDAMAVADGLDKTEEIDGE